MQEHVGPDFASSRKLSALHDIERTTRSRARAAALDTWPSNSADSGAWASPSSAWRAELGRVIEAEILPRLMLIHSERGAGSAPPARREDDPADVADFADLLIGSAADGATDYLHRALRSGRSTPDILLDLMAPAARRLGTLWERDDCDFVQVTIGLRRLQDMLNWLSADHEGSFEDPGARPRALLMPTPGESHGFGVAMVETFFRADGWRVDRGDVGFLAALRREVFDVVGFSVSCERYLDALATAVRQSRAASRNRAIRVLVGGPLFEAREALAARVEADGVATDAITAVRLARSLLRERVLV
jgi:methanogenic corrinoid protein MtbC1